MQRADVASVHIFAHCIFVASKSVFFYEMAFALFLNEKYKTVFYWCLNPQPRERQMDWANHFMPKYIIFETSGVVS